MTTVSIKGSNVQRLARERLGSVANFHPGAGWDMLTAQADWDSVMIACSP